MKVDDLYLENLAEYVFDEKQFVTYKHLSMKLGVNVNLAKQMLYHFYDIKKSEGKKIHAMYYLSGMAPKKWVSTIGVEEEDCPDSLASQDSQKDYNKDSFLILLCKDHELEEFKKKFSRLYSVHVYGLSSFVLEGFDILNQAMGKPLRDDDGNAPVHFGPLTCTAAFEYRENPVIAPLLKNVQEVKANLIKTKEKHEKEKQQQEKPKESNKPVERIEPATSPSKGRHGTSSNTSKKPVDKSSKNGGPDRLKNMFAAAASRPKSKEVVEQPKKEVHDKDSSNEKEDRSNKTSSSKSKFGNKDKAQKKPKEKGRETLSRKRKRIKDVFSSSSDEDEEKGKNKMSEDEGDYIPESPIPRKKIQIESDSDDDFVVEKTPVKPEQVPVEKPVSGKRRALKTLPRTFVDDEGFLVTEMEQVMVSEDEEESKEAEKKGKPEKMDAKPSSETASSANRKKESSTSKRPISNISSTSTSSNSSNKTKQASIMSFFSKK